MNNSKQIMMQNTQYCSEPGVVTGHHKELQETSAPLNLAGHAIVADLLGKVGDGLLQAHVEAQPLTEVVSHLQEQGYLAPHA